MHSLSIFILSLIGQVTAWPSRTPQRHCGVSTPSWELRQVHHHFNSEPHRPVEHDIRVNTYFHIVSSSAYKGRVTQKMLDDQLNVIQSNYLQHRISFELHGIDQTIHDQWATGNDPLSMKRYLRRGSYQDLNVYFLTDWRSKMGLSSLPKKAPNSTELILDGCDIDASSMPGGWQSDAFNHGMTAVHEIGHWFGLLHVFQPSGPGVDPDGPGTCDGPGDYVADTPTQRDPTKGCPKRQDSCPKLPGLDDSHNIMDYSDDKCLTHFTLGQRQRMHQMFNRYRSGHYLVRTPFGIQDRVNQAQHKSDDNI